MSYVPIVVFLTTLPILEKKSSDAGIDLTKCYLCTCTRNSALVSSLVVVGICL